MRKILAVIGLLAASLFAVVLSDEPAPDADLTIILIQDNFTLDPQRMSYNHDLRAAMAIYEGLGRWDNEDPDLTVHPAAATSWDISADGLTYTFHIRPEARWSNGDPLTAHDFVYSWGRAMYPDTAAEYSGLFFRIKGAEAFFEWRSAQTSAYTKLTNAERLARFGLTDASGTVSARLAQAAQMLREEAEAHMRDTVGLRAEGDHTLIVELERPTPYFIDLTAFGVFYPVHKPTVERFVSVDPKTGRIKQRPDWTKPEHNVVNGPYVVSQWRFKRDMILQANPNYWKPDIVRSHTVKLIPIEDGNTGMLTFLNGDVDWHSDLVGVGYIDAMIRKKKYDTDPARNDYDAVHVLSTFGTYFWWFNCRERLNDGEPNPFHDAGVRRAFALAVDKQAIVDKVKKTGEKVSDVFVPRGSIGGFKSPQGLAYNPARAKEELAEAGWMDRDGDGRIENEEGRAFPVVELLCSTAAYHQDVALAMGRMWEKTLGIDTKVVARESKVYKDNLINADYMMARGGWFGDYGDPTTFLDLHKTGDGQNNSGYSDPYLDDLLARADVEPDAQARLRLLEEAERYTMDETVPILPIWQYNYYYGFWDPEKPDGSPNPGGLRGISFHPRLIQYIWKMERVTGDGGEAAK